MRHLPSMLVGAIMTFAAMFAINAIAAFNLSVPQGPGLGNNDVNPYTLANAINQNNGMLFTATLTAGAANTQSTCAVVVNPLTDITTSAANGSICLPPAFAGREIFIGNASGQTINIFGSNTPFTPGTQDTINGTTGSTAYTSLTSGKNAQCFVPANGAWFCSSGN